MAEIGFVETTIHEKGATELRNFSIATLYTFAMERSIKWLLWRTLLRISINVQVDCRSEDVFN